MADALEDALASRARLVGTVLSLPGAATAELLAEPFDFVWVDLEHAALGPRDAQELILGAQAAQAYALVRLPADAHALMTVMLDAGADGIVLANVSDAAQAEAASARAVHPPDGVRGWGPRRLAMRRRGRDARRRPSIWAQIESAEGVARTEAIAAVRGIDAVVVGTADLSFALGVPLESGAPELLEAIGAVRAGSERAGVALGVAGALEDLPETALGGASILVHATDARICGKAVDATAAWLRGVA
jgi:2-keto-3-deoxy-L-rhamnonate aldolase RhmA